MKNRKQWKLGGGQKTLAPWDSFLGQMRGQSVLSPLGFDFDAGEAFKDLNGGADVFVAVAGGDGGLEHLVG